MNSARVWSTGRLVRWGALASLLVAIVWVVAHREALNGPAVEAWLAGLGGWAGPSFVVVYALGALLFVPGSLLTLAGGALFGPVEGTLLSLAGATAGATLAFVLARSMGGEWVARRLDGRLGRLVRGLESDGWRFVAFVRLVPLFPFNLLNYALGLTRLRLGVYVVTTAVCMVPGAAAYTWLGHAGREALQGSQTALQSGLFALGLLAAVAYLLPHLGRRLRRAPRVEVGAFQEELDGGAGVRVLDVRERGEYCDAPGHIPGSVCIPLDELAERLGELGPTGSELVVVCRTDRRSTQAAGLLARTGFARVRVLAGGVEGWSRAGLPLAKCTREAG